MGLKNLAAAVALAAGLASSANALTFNLSFIAGTSAQEQASFTVAAAAWSAIFDDAVTVKLTVGTGNLGAGILAQAGSRRLSFTYGSARGALVADASNSFDALAAANLDVGASAGMLINRTSNNPNGAGSATAYVDNDGDANNSIVRMTAANARALGGIFGVGGVAGGCADCDAFIQFSTNFTWDHDRSNGISATDFDFIGIAIHEIGHAMGFISGVDVLDGNSPPVNGPFRDDQFTFVSPLDLFRWSADSTAANVHDWTADRRDKCFSIDRGATCGPLFSNGTNFGDGRQASHWKDSLGIGALDPTAARGELIQISENDIQAFDVIGWDRIPARVSEPTGLALAGLSLALMGAAARRRRVR